MKLIFIYEFGMFSACCRLEKLSIIAMGNKKEFK